VLLNTLIPSLDSMNGLGMWLTPRDRAILKARRKTRSSHGKSALPQRTPASKGESVADPYDQTSLVEFARSEDPAMVKAVETPSAITPSGQEQAGDSSREKGGTQESLTVHSQL